MTRSRVQQEQSARQLLKNAFAQGLDDDGMIDFATAALGEELRPLIGRVHAREFTATRPI